MKIEAGKFYRSRNNRKVGPMRPLPPDHDTGAAWEGHFPGEITRTFYANGRWRPIPWRAAARPASPWLSSHQQTERDLVSEWTDEPTGPVITETVKRIVPGKYGRIEVGPTYSSGRVDVALGPHGYLLPFSEADLRAAAATLLEIADALVKP